MENIFYLWGLAVSLKILRPEVAAAPVPIYVKNIRRFNGLFSIKSLPINLLKFKAKLESAYAFVIPSIFKNVSLIFPNESIAYTSIL